MAETVAEEIARLLREIGDRQARLQYLVLGDPRIGVTVVPRNPSWAMPLDGCIHCKAKPCVCAIAQANG